jgi:hypothetical protein
MLPKDKNQFRLFLGDRNEGAEGGPPRTGIGGPKLSELSSAASSMSMSI